ncbi:hypothetical protein [Erwinia piriflorinigrans]|uniref:Conserved membrane protein hofO n=1 Tax=Erwinia piriflorinigrans CFBP 5888 TaxID=1161919 RepID=V5ZC69_9GAMM|nr:hypothetical protein [Erwinia piriflorinigrans]CCG88875.1 Conserved membrane protein hofO [Erwinia piriflorinigrans CFBP 5888]
MNNRWLLVWLQLETGWFRLTSFCGVTLLLTLLLWYCWLYPAQRQQQQQEQQLHQHILEYQQQLRSLAGLPSLTVSQREVVCLQQLLLPAAAMKFTLPELLSTSGAELVHWRPTEQGGELAVTLQWPLFARLLNYLSALQPVPAFPMFSLNREEAQLRLVMELIDES